MHLKITNNHCKNSYPKTGTLFRPLGSVIPDAVFADIGLFFDNDQLYEFSLFTPRTNRFMKNYRFFEYSTVRICMTSADTVDILTGIGYNHRRLEIDTAVDDPSKKLAFFLSKCRIIDDLSCMGVLFDDAILKSMINIRSSYIRLDNGASFNVSLPLFLSFLHRHGKVTQFHIVYFPCELITNETLRMMSYTYLSCETDGNRVANIDDEILKDFNTHVELRGYKTKFTIKGISNYLKNTLHDGDNIFGILDFNQLDDALEFERNHIRGNNTIRLISFNGLKTINFFIDVGRAGTIQYSVDITLKVLNSIEMVSLPNDLVGQMTQESFHHFNKIFDTIGHHEQVGQYRLNSISFSYHENLIKKTYSLTLSYEVLDESTNVWIDRSGISYDELVNIIAGILGNCTSIHKLDFRSMNSIIMDEKFYQILKPIALNINIDMPWETNISLLPESLCELLKAENGLFANIDYFSSEYVSKELLPNKVLKLWIAKKFNVDVNLLPIELSSNGSPTSLTDSLLYQLSSTLGKMASTRFFENYPNSFTADGIKTVLQASQIVDENADRRDPLAGRSYCLGTIEMNKEVYNLIQKYEEDFSQWNIKKTFVLKEEKYYITVVIEYNRRFGLDLSRYPIRVEFDIPIRVQE